MCPDGNDNANVSDWSGVVMAWTVSLVCEQFGAHHIDCAKSPSGLDMDSRLTG